MPRAPKAYMKVSKGANRDTRELEGMSEFTAMPNCRATVIA